MGSGEALNTNLLTPQNTDNLASNCLRSNPSTFYQNGRPDAIFRAFMAVVLWVVSDRPEDGGDTFPRYASNKSTRRQGNPQTLRRMQPIRLHFTPGCQLTRRFLAVSGFI